MTADYYNKEDLSNA
jgi:hypothetical protein